MIVDSSMAKRACQAKWHGYDTKNVGILDIMDIMDFMDKDQGARTISIRSIKSIMSIAFQSLFCLHSKIPKW